ncbi:nitrous oxide reductase accessory protein NosL [Fervidibacillus halotolerans]|uniref:Nitrous oxide reductase accessory protein NosL n=1 Tax=Fervidibacillus halotolerans TaxID=2980027 RepID=A0A9E8M223_9BACI|nr:nitrous oxide reductase accessory protein NosL [Fervidibacillus halotolerans]WAA12986.1 nitrous oxide reductase accessory protein NosL [Fervidibacillus halotolerans]
MKSIKTSITILIILLFTLSACGKKEVQPVSINEETDKCEVCNMAVADNEFATQVVMENGKSYVYDDIGCMFVWFDENEDGDVAASFVRDFNTKEWIKTEEATYVYDRTVRTPMAYNVISFKNEKDAKAYMEENQGEVLTYDQLLKHDWPVNEEMKKMNMEQHQNHNHDEHDDHGHDHDEDHDGE